MSARPVSIIDEVLEQHSWDVELNTTHKVSTVVCRCGLRFGFSQSHLKHVQDAVAQALSPSATPRVKTLSGVQWPRVVGDWWSKHASRFASAWNDLPHHDQVTVMRLISNAQDDTL